MAQKKHKDTTVAKVNNEELYENQLETAVKDYNASLKEQGINLRSLGQDQLHNVRKFMLQKMIERELLHQEAIKKKIKVSAAEIDQLMAEMEKRYPSRQAFLDDVLTDNMTEEAYKNRLAYDMLVNKIAAKRYEERKKELTEKDIQTFYQKNRQLFAQPESVNIGHILIKVSDSDDGKVWEKAKNKLLNIRRKKEDFRELARKHSQCLSSKKGGDLGYYSRGQLYAPLEIAAFKLKANEISEPVESREGVHLIKVYERRPQGFIPPFEEIKEDVGKVAKTDQAQKIYQDYIDELKKKARIDIYED